ncbi:MAG: aminopeptidase [Paludibacteraceae bacterium]|nr:aminopeptidase [Paludibacteraceae bacterium]
MRKRIILLVAIAALAAGANAKTTKFAKMLKAIPGVTSITKIESTRFGERYIVTFRQFIDHRDTALGTFEQRVIVGNVHTDSATVFVTEGYSASYTERKDYREELSDILNANSVIIEHRYFNKSIPVVKDKEKYWDYLTTYNAATDHHRIVEAFRKLYKGKYIATGVSKGGICANLFRAYYPEDVDVTVPYVAPFCDGVEDKKMSEEIVKYGSSDEREYLTEYMRKMFARREEFLPMLQEYVDSLELQPRVELAELYDLTVLDMEIAVLARGEIKKLPELDKATDKELFRALAKYGSPEGFTPAYDNMPYYVQAAKELGHYAYDISRFEGLLSIQSTEEFLRRCALPEDFDFEYDPSTREMVIKFLQNTDSHMLFIYGEYDPWTAVGIKDYVSNPNIYVMVNPGNCHKSKIWNFPEEMRNKILSVLRSWL